MSIQISSAVWKADIGDPVAKFVLLKLADNANDQGKCWPSVATIAAETELCERTIQTKIRALEKAGLLVCNRGMNCCDYTLVMDRITSCTPQEMHPAGDAPRRRCAPQEIPSTPQEMHRGVQEMRGGGAGDAVASGEPSLNRHRTVIEPSGHEEPKPLCTLEQALSYAPTARLTPEQATFWWHTRNAAGWTKGTQGGGAGRKITSFQSDMQASAGWIAEAMAKANGGKVPSKKFSGMHEVLEMPDA